MGRMRTSIPFWSVNLLITENDMRRLCTIGRQGIHEVFLQQRSRHLVHAEGTSRNQRLLVGLQSITQGSIWDTCYRRVHYKSNATLTIHSSVKKRLSS